MKLQSVRKIVFLLTVIIISGGIGYNFGQSNRVTRLVKNPLSWPAWQEAVLNRQTPISKQAIDFNQFWQVWDALETKYYRSDQMDANKMVQGAISGMVASIKDPWTVYLPPPDNQRAKEDLSGQFEGVGIQLGFKNEKLTVIAPIKGMAADKAGIRAGDFILHIKDDSKKIDLDTAGLSIYEAVEYIRGAKETIVELTIARDNEEEEKKFAIKRETINVPSVELDYGAVISGQWVEEKDLAAADRKKIVALLKLNQFGDSTMTEWTQAVEKIKQREESGEVIGLVLDLRNNPGGYLSGAVSLASEFIDKGVIVKQDGGDGSKADYAVNRKGILLDIPLTVLINKGSASASEILAGALRYYGRGKLVGEKTFGKGSIQEAVELDGGAGLHVTTAKWLLPDGRWINDNQGLEPDITVENPKDDETKDMQLLKAIELLINNK